MIVASQVNLLENWPKLDIVGGVFCSPASGYLFSKSSEVDMKKRFLLAVALLLSIRTASAGTTQKWTAGWDDFSEPLSYTKSNVIWSVNATTRKLTVTFNLVGANPNKLYQVG